MAPTGVSLSVIVAELRETIALSAVHLEDRPLDGLGRCLVLAISTRLEGK